MISNPRHGSPPRLMAHQPTRCSTTQEPQSESIARTPYETSPLLPLRRHCHDSHWPDPNSPCPSAALLHRSRAASSLVLGCFSGGRFGFSSPISTLDASLTLLLGELRGRAFRSPVRARSLAPGPTPQRPRGCRSWAF